MSKKGSTKRYGHLVFAAIPPTSTELLRVIIPETELDA
jgi:hypothetical protein